MKILLLALIFGGLGTMAGATDAGSRLRAGQQALRRSDHAQAIRMLGEAAALAPGDADIQHWLGNAYAWAAAGAELCDKPALGRKCLAAYRRALALDPDNLPARFSLMNFYRHVPRLLGGGMGRARAEAEEIGRRDPVLGLHAQAVLHAHEKDYEAALATLDRVRRTRPEFYAAHALFGRLALESGRRQEEGVAALQRCLELTPDAADESHATVQQWLAQLAMRTSPPEIAARRL